MKVGMRPVIRHDGAPTVRAMAAISWGVEEC